MFRVLTEFLREHSSFQIYSCFIFSTMTPLTEKPRGDRKGGQGESRAEIDRFSVSASLDCEADYNKFLVIW